MEFNSFGGVSYLKDYGDYYKVSVCKGVFTSSAEFSPDEVEWMQEMMGGCTKRYARICLHFLNQGSDAFARFLERSRVAVEDLPDELGRYMNNIVRARSTIEQLGAMNPWQYFVTFTISPEKFDRYDFKSFYKTFSNFVAHYKRKTGVKIAYLFVPERHKDGAWHLHGLINGLPLEHLRPFRLDERLPVYILDKLRQGQQLYEWTAFAEKFGYTIVEPLRDPARAASYITKYIGKGFAKDYMMKNARLFMPSLGLKRAELIKKGFADLSSAKPVFDCEYATTYKFPKSEYSLDDVQSMFL